MSYQTREGAKGYTPAQLRTMAQNIREYVHNGREEFFFENELRKKGRTRIVLRGLPPEKGKALLNEANRLDELAEEILRPRFKE